MSTRGTRPGVSRLLVALALVVGLFGADQAAAQNRCTLTSADIPSLTASAGSTNVVVLDTSNSATLATMNALCPGGGMNNFGFEAASPSQDIANNNVITLPSGSTIKRTTAGTTRTLTYSAAPGVTGSETVSPFVAAAGFRDAGQTLSVTGRTARFYPLGSAVGVYFTVVVTVTAPNAPTAALTSLSPSTIAAGGTSTVTVTLANPNGAALSGVADIINLPANVVIAATPSAGTTCTGGVASATAGASGATLSGASMAANATCAITFDVTSSTVAAYTIASGTPSATGANAGSAGTNATLTVGAAATVTAISPTSGPAGGGNSAVITGTGFTGTTGAAGVKFGATNATSYTVNSDTQITAVAPAGSAGTVDVTVTNGSTSATSAADQYTYIAAPTVTSISPTAGPTGGGTTVTLTGANFTGAIAVTFGATPAASFTVNSATQITATSPAGTGTVDIRVTTAGGASATSAADQFTFVAPSTVTSISPMTGPGFGGTAVVITGTNFTGATAATFGATAAASFTVDSATQITASSPAGGGTVDIRVTTAGGTSATSAADQFTFIGTPTVTGLSQTAGPATGGTTVVLTGTNFIGVIQVRFGIANATDVTVNSATQITATSPLNNAGTVNVRVIATGGTSATAAANQYTYVAAPTVTALSPTAGPAGGGTTVTITGTGFTGATAVTFGATAASGFTVNSATQITATAPAGTGTVDARVTTTGGTSATSAADQYTYVAAPTVTSLSPTAGPAGGGTTVTITGTNFAGATAVTFGATAATGYTVNSATQITATAPSGTGTVDTRVTTTGGTSATSAADQYTYVTAPTVTSISPTAGPTGGGTTVTITGTGFSGTTAVTFGATAASGFTVNSATQITATAPSGTGTVNVRVTTTGGTSPTAAGNQYTYIAAPTATSISPTAGPTGGGTTVTITGTNFSGATAVTFGATAASGFTVNSATQITAISPSGTGTVNVRITTVGGTSATAAGNQFTYIAPVVLSPAGGALPGGTATTAYSQTFTAGGGTGPYTYGLTGTPPTGLTLTGNTLSGTPTASGTFNFAITATDSSTAVAGSAFTATENYAITIAAANQTITFNTLPDASLSASPLTLAATAISELAVSFASTTSGICTVSGSTLSLLQTGFCTITASQDGDADWNAATPVEQSFNVLPATLTITPAAPTGTAVGAAYSQANPAAGGTAPYTYALASGALPAGAAINSATGIVSGTPSAAGAFSYAIQATDAQGTPVTATGTTVAGTIAKGDQTLSFTSTAPVGAVAGGTPYPAVATAASGLGAVLTIDASSSAVCTISAGTVSFIGSGTCTIDANQAGDGNWNPASQVQQGFAVGAAAPTITSVTPDTGYTTSTTAVSIVGTNFTGATAVSFGGNAATGVTVVDASHITATAPTGTAGAKDVTVTTPGGTATLTNGFTYLAAPVAADRSGVAVGYGTATPIDLSTSISGGAHGSIAIATAPAHGTTSIAGDLVTYTPAAGYYGADSFTYTATGPGGTSAPATVSLTVATPAAPTAADKSGVAVPYNGTGTGIDLSGSITSVHTSIAAATAPAHGATSIAGDVVTYTPAADYYGADSFAYTATGPGGTSAPATVSLTVATPGVPTVADVSGIAVPYNNAGAAIDLSASITGVHTSIAVATAPAHGTIAIAGDVITYTPAAGYYGADSFSYTATGPGGTSAPATATLNVATPAPPTVADKGGVTVSYNSGGTAIDLSGSIGGVHTGIAVATAPAHGTTSIAGDVITYTPADGYYGADSFTYTATGPGGTSARATVSLTVATPATPTVADKSDVAIPYNSAGTAIDLGGSVAGVHTSIAIATAPTHGTTSIAGDVITYTPAAGYYGVDSFTYTATGPGGTSAPATVNMTVATPAVPTVADKPGVAVAYGSSGTAIYLSGSVTGVHNALAVAAAPTHGTVSVAGDTATYMPAAGYSGPDSFTYTATGPGGTSAAASVGLTVSAPVIAFTLDTLPNAAQDSAYNAQLGVSGGTAPYIYSSTSGALPAGLALSATGLISGTPIENGSFTFAIQASDSTTGAGPSSATRSYILTVAAPPPPMANDAGETSVVSAIAGNSQSVEIDLSSLVTGDYDEIRIDTPPQHGTVTLNRTGASATATGIRAAAAAAARWIATYTPNANFAGTDRFTFVAVGPGGTSAPAAVIIDVIGQAPGAAALTASTISGQEVIVDLTTTAQQGPFTGATIVSISPANSAAATLVEGGTPASRSYRMRIKPDGRFSGTAVVTYTLANLFGSSAPATVTVMVEARPDPSQDPVVRGLVAAQADAAKRFATTQLDNFSRRNEQLHNGGGASKGHAMGFSLSSSDRQLIQRPGDQPEIPDVLASKMGHAASSPATERTGETNIGGARGLSATLPGGVRAHGTDGATPAAALAGTDDGGDGSGRDKGSLAIWSGGAIQIGTHDAQTDRARLSMTTSGLSAGVDLKLGAGAIFGIGGGYGGQRTDIGQDERARLTGTSWVGAAYGSLRPFDGAFIDAVAGIGGLDFSTRRIAANDQLTIGNRDGTMRFGSLSFGLDRSGAKVMFSGYARGEYISATLGGYRENGAGLYDLRFAKRDLTSFSSVIGFRGSMKVETTAGLLIPRARFEWRHEFQDGSSQFLDYADLAGLTYRIDETGWLRDAISPEIGIGLQTFGWTFGIDVTGQFGQGSRSAILGLSLGREF